MEKLISVVIPVYNCGQYIERCLDSICANTYHQLEIILVDDGSTDESGLLCDTYAAKDVRIKVYHRNNHGVSATRNFGIQNATGEYIAFVDGDDIVNNVYFEELLLAIHNADFAVGVLAHIENGQISVSKPLNEKEVRIDLPLEEDKEAFWRLNSSFLLYGPVNKLYRLSVIRNSNVSFPVDTWYGEDLLFNFSYLERCSSIGYTKNSVYYYNHDNDGSLSHRYRENRFENGLRMNNKIYNYCIKRDLLTPKMEKFIAGRIFDDAYNSLFDLWNEQCKLEGVNRYKRVKEIMCTPELIKACSVAEINGYKPIYVIMIKKRMAACFSVVRCCMSKRKR